MFTAPTSMSAQSRPDAVVSHAVQPRASRGSANQHRPSALPSCLHIRIRQRPSLSRLSQQLDSRSDVLGRRHLVPLAVGGGGQKGSRQESFWEGEEGQQKMDEIGELKEIVRERIELEKQLKELEERGLVDHPGEGGEGELDPEEAAARAEARAEARALKLRELLEKKAQEQTARRKDAQALFVFGQRAYGKGVYDQSVKIFEAALDNVESGSRLGGDIQLWLAMAYDANGQRRQCIDLYKKLEQGHPWPPIRKQAYELRYIAEAPKIKMSPDEILTIPILGSDSQSTQRTWSQMVRERRPKRIKPLPKGSTDIWNDLEGYTPPKWEQSPYFWVALTLWLTLVGVALVFQE